MHKLLYEASNERPVLPSCMFQRVGGFSTSTVTGRHVLRGSVVSRRVERRFLAKCGHILSQEPDIGGFCAVCLLELQAFQVDPANALAQALSVEELLWACVHCRACHCGACRAVGCEMQGLCRLHARAVEGVCYCEPHAMALEMEREEQVNGRFRTRARRFVASLFLPDEA